jgi:hypothetical protein
VVSVPVSSTIDELRRVGEAVGQRDVELGPVGDQAGAPDLEDELLPQHLLLGDEGVVELEEAVPAEGAVRRPRGLVEGPAGGVDGPVHVARRGVGDPAELLPGRRVEDRERAGAAVGEGAVDEHPGLELDSG